VNSRLDELHAAVLRVKLPHLDRWNALRRQIAWKYNAGLADHPAIDLPLEPGDHGSCIAPADDHQAPDSLYSVYHQYTVQVDDRDAVAQRLHELGVGCAVYYPVPLHRQEVYRTLGYADGCFPAAERAARRCLSLPMFPELTAAEQGQVLSCLRQAVDGGVPARRAA
jgi:dTDP-4-amino-4,6-dideoxygalactose transaminase